MSEDLARTVTDVLILGQLDAGAEHRLKSRYRTESWLDVTTVDTMTCLDAVAETVRVIVVRSPFRVSRPLIMRCRQLQAIVRAGSGTDNIDLVAAAERHVAVHTTPLASRSVAELAFGLLLSVARDIPGLHDSLKAGQWRKWDGVGVELGGRTLAIVGFGGIGRAVAALAAAFDMRVLIVDPTPHKLEKRVCLEHVAGEIATLGDALRRADAIVLCCPLTAATRGMIGQRELAVMKPGVILVNVARDELVEGKAVLDALRAGRLYGFGVDGFADPSRVDPDLIATRRVVATPHVGAQTRECGARIGEAVEQLVATYLTPS